MSAVVPVTISEQTERLAVSPGGAGAVMQSAWREVLRGILRSPEGREIAREFLAIVREELTANTSGLEWYDQKSPQARASLGRNRWCRAVRERLQRDPRDPHAKHIGDRWLLDTQGLSEELDRASNAPPPSIVKASPPPEPDESPRAARVRDLLRGAH